jgi:sec-independent protein translocase protein TatA
MERFCVLAVMGWTEYLVIAALLLLLFGARKLPELAAAMGSSIQSFKKGMREGAEDDSAKRARDGERKNGHDRDEPGNGASH